jgi:hypothetical protein
MGGQEVTGTGKTGSEPHPSELELISLADRAGLGELVGTWAGGGAPFKGPRLKALIAQALTPVVFIPMLLKPASTSTIVILVVLEVVTTPVIIMLAARENRVWLRQYTGGLAVGTPKSAPLVASWEELRAIDYQCLGTPQQVARDGRLSRVTIEFPDGTFTLPLGVRAKRGTPPIELTGNRVFAGDRRVTYSELTAARAVPAGLEVATPNGPVLFPDGGIDSAARFAAVAYLNELASPGN